MLAREATSRSKTDLAAMRENTMHQRLLVGVTAFAWGLATVTVTWGQGPAPTGSGNPGAVGSNSAAGRQSAAGERQSAAGRNATPRNGTARNNMAGPNAGTERATGNSADLSGELRSGPPGWWPLREDHEKYLDEILDYWEYNTERIQRYECKFTRWIYDPSAVKADSQSGEIPAREISQGVIKYMTPASAMYKVEKVYGYRGPEGEKPSRYDELDTERFGEHWVCDGKSIFEFDYGQKLLKQIVLPEEAQDEAISKGPLPFLFRAKKDEIKERFWIRVITPEGKSGEYWLEAYPRTQEDAAHFKFVHIIIDQKEFLPKALILFKRTFTERSPARETFAFEDRQVNLTWKNFLQGLQVWKRDFFAPAVPAGWKKVVQEIEAGPAPNRATDISPPQAGSDPLNSDTARPTPTAQPTAPRTTRAPNRGPAAR